MSQVSYERHEQFCKVILPVQCTAPLVPSLKNELKTLLADGVSEVEFDMSATEMLDSSGIGLLTAVSNSLTQQQGTIRVTGVSDPILRLLKMMRLIDRLNISGRPL